MSRTTIELKLPEGYELDDGEQPRPYISGDTVARLHGDGTMHCEKINYTPSPGFPRFILRKIKPREYHVVVDKSSYRILGNGFDSRQKAEQWATANNGHAVTLIEKPEEPAP